MLKPLIIGMTLLVLCAGITAVSALGGDEAWYRVHCNIDGADVYFDGQYQGTTYGGTLDVPVYSTGTPYSTVRVEKSGYHTYTASLPSSPAAGETRDVYATLQPVETAGSIHVTSSPSGAAIYLNGNYRGTAPLTIKNLSPGTYSLDAERSGYLSDRSTVTVRAGQQSNIQFTLTPIEQYGSIKVTSSPSSAYVYMDGVYKGRTPLTLTSVSAKKHNIELDLSGYYDWKSTVTVSPGVTSYVNAYLTSVPSETTGAIDVVSYPAGADVFLDDKYQGKTPSAGVYTISNVPVGSHTVRVALSGYQDYTTGVVVSGATTSHVTATLQPGQSTSTGSISVTSSPSGAEVYIDNAYKGVTPVTVDGIATGTHAIRVALGGYSDWSTSVQVGTGSTASASASLSPVPTEAPPHAGVAPFAVVGALGILGLFVALRRRD
ncbi:PEGA domain-containing protein [Methanoculleus sp. FWC-SCC3]|uniref:PEGA domain-containing protein n=1 Tax=Methanoculleus methanifontis TaxID=2584086 RepID=A0ABT8M1E1_9EURY|nr:PEGA domain-containing protein [Methanoculleus sp. FWC-SCC3]MDN7012839.1 PEGA domain-containing protein [Methanoculleus sp. FWC-SCC3]